MKRLHDLSLIDVMLQLTTVDKAVPMTVERGFRHLMFMEAIAREIQNTNSTTITISKIGELAKEHGGEEVLSLSQVSLYCRLAELTHRLILP